MLELYVPVLNRLSSIHRSERGQTMAEYGFILALIAVICAVSVGFLGGAVTGLLDAITAAV